VAVEKHGVGLVILDSVAANYRAEFEKKGERDGGASMAKRGNQVVQLGSLLRNLARTKGIAVVVANQVADRFTRPPPSNSVSRTTSANSQGSITSTVNTPPLSLGAEPTQSNTEEVVVISPDPLALDHQQRWFTGWGDIRSDPAPSLKTPSLGLVWTNQIACRIALLKKPVYASRALVVNVNGEDQFNDEERHISKWRRWLKVVFSSWAAPSEGRGVEFEILRSGLRHIQKKPLDSN
jgi:DNA repair protein RAD57